MYINADYIFQEASTKRDINYYPVSHSSLFLTYWLLDSTITFCFSIPVACIRSQRGTVVFCLFLLCLFDLIKNVSYYFTFIYAVMKMQCVSDDEEKKETRQRALMKYQEKLCVESISKAEKKHKENKYALETMLKVSLIS